MSRHQGPNALVSTVTAVQITLAVIEVHGDVCGGIVRLNGSTSGAMYSGDDR